MNSSSSWEKALQQYEAAEYLLKVTFPFIQEPKLFLGIITNLFSSVEETINSLLEDYHQKRDEEFNYPHFKSKFNFFRENIAPLHHIPYEFIELAMTLNEIVTFHRQSPIEFQRRSAFIICNKELQHFTLTKKDLDSSLVKTKRFLLYVSPLLNRPGPK